MTFPTIDEIREVSSVRDIARRAGIGVRTLYEWLEAGGPPRDGAMGEFQIKLIHDAVKKARHDKKAKKPPRTTKETKNGA